MFAALADLGEVSILAIGDLMLDAYTFGTAKRVSPEAPVLVLQGQKREFLPGGVGNAALNLKSLGANVTLMGRIGDDNEGKLLLELLDKTGIDSEGIITQNNYPTIVKHRVIASHQQLLRIDTETFVPVTQEIENQILETFATQVTKYDAIAISDYGKGFLTKRLLQGVIQLARSHRIPVVVDPKGLDFEKYSGATMIKPNEKEAYDAALLAGSVSIDKVGQTLLKTTQCQYILITRSEKGMVLFAQDEKKDFPVKAQSVVDVTGAGDTVLALVTLGFANRLDLSETIQLANIAASIAIEEVGCCPITLSALAERLLKFSTKSKIYEEDHLYALKHVLAGHPYVLFKIEEKVPFTAELLVQMKQMRKTGKLIVYLSVDDEAMTTFLTSLTDVDYIIIKKPGIDDRFFAEMKPVQVYTPLA